MVVRKLRKFFVNYTLCVYWSKTLTGHTVSLTNSDQPIGKLLGVQLVKTYLTAIF